MEYLIKIEETNNDLAVKLIDYLRSLAQTDAYNFLKIAEYDKSTLTESQKNELDDRYEHFLKHHNDYKDWDDVKQKYL